MLQNRSDSERNAERFFERIAATGTAWLLVSPEGGLGYCPSHEAEADVFLFWSDRAYAKRQCKDGWDDYEPTEIDMEQLAGMWAAMRDDGQLIGLNWDANLCGLELEAGTALKILDSA